MSGDFTVEADHGNTVVILCMNEVNCILMGKDEHLLSYNN